MRSSATGLPMGPVMVWDQYFLTRFALVVFSMIAAIFWFIVGFEISLRGPAYDPIYLVFPLHSVGMIGLNAGMFGQRQAALFVTLFVGVMWFAANVILLLIILQVGFHSFLDPLRVTMLCFQACSGFALFFLTWLLVRSSRQIPGHFREF